MNQDIAIQIAELLNERNKLTKEYDSEKIMDKINNYVYILE